jgi:hypothetical protein
MHLVEVLALIGYFGNAWLKIFDKPHLCQILFIKVEQRISSGNHINKLSHRFS